MADTKVRGITIELTADTTGIIKGLKECNSQIRTTASQLRDVDRLLKLDPTNMTLLKQRTQMLQEQVGTTTKKLEQLKAAQAKMKADGIDENSEQYRALQREIISTEQRLKELNATAGSGSAKLLQISNATGKIGETAESAGKKFMPLTAGILAIGGAAVKTAADFDAQMSKVQAISGATADDMDQLRDAAREMAAGSKFTAEEAGQALEYMAMAGWKTEDMLAGLPGIISLSAAANEDLGKTSDIVTDGLTAFGMKADEAGRFADVLAAASSNANTNVSMLGESFKYAAPVAGAMGYSVEDVAAALGLMANSGIKASSAGTALRTIFTNMAKPTDEMAHAMEVLGISLDDGQGNMKSFRDIMLDLREGFKGLKIPEEEATKALTELDQQLEDGTITQKQYDKMAAEWIKSAYGAEGALKAEAAAALAGKKGLSGLLAIVNASDEDFEKLTSAIDNSEGAAKKMADTMQDNLAGQFTILKSQLEEAGISIGEMLIPYLRKGVEWVQNLVDKFNDLPQSTKDTIVKVAGLVAAIGPLLIAFGKVSKAISAITKVMSTLNFVKFITNPVTLAIGAIAGLAAVLITLINNQEKAIKACHPFRDALDDLAESSDGVERQMRDTKKAYNDNAAAAEAEAEMANQLNDELQNLVGIEDKTATQKEKIKSLVEKLNELVPNLNLAYDEQADKLSKTNKQIEQNINLTKLQAETDAISSAYSDAMETRIKATQNANKAQDIYNSTMAESSDAAKQYVKDVEAGASAFELSWKYTAGDIEQGKHLLESKQALDEATQNLNDSRQDESAYAAMLAGSEQKLTEATAQQAKEINAIDLRGFRQELKNTLGEGYTADMKRAVNRAIKTGTEIPQSLRDGILNGEVSVTDAVTQINTAVDTKLSENKAAVKTTGDQTVKGFTTAIQNGAAGARTAAEKVASSTNSGLNSGKSGARSAGAGKGTAFNEGLASTVHSVTGTATAMVNKATTALAGGKDAAYQRGREYGQGFIGGLTSMSGDIGAAVLNLMQHSVIEKTKAAIKSGSPSRVARERGQEYGEGFGLGLLDMIRSVARATAALAATATDGMDGYLSTASMLSARPGAVGLAGGAGGVTNVTNNSYNQTNYSPRPLSPAEVYRQTNNLLLVPQY